MKWPSVLVRKGRRPPNKPVTSVSIKFNQFTPVCLTGILPMLFGMLESPETAGKIYKTVFNCVANI